MLEAVVEELTQLLYAEVVVIVSTRKSMAGWLQSKLYVASGLHNYDFVAYHTTKHD